MTRGLNSLASRLEIHLTSALSQSTCSKTHAHTHTHRLMIKVLHSTLQKLLIHLSLRSAWHQHSPPQWSSVHDIEIILKIEKILTGLLHLYEQGRRRLLGGHVPPPPSSCALPFFNESSDPAGVAATVFAANPSHQQPVLPRSRLLQVRVPVFPR